MSKLKEASKKYVDSLGEPMSPLISALIQVGFKYGAKHSAQPVQRLGEIIQQYATRLPPNVVEELRTIFELNKEIVDE